MLRSPLFLISILACTLPCLADFGCPTGTTFLERKDEAQWMKACLNANAKLHGPFEVWSQPAVNLGGVESYRKTTLGQYTNGSQSGIWIYWNIEGEKVDEKTFQ